MRVALICERLESWPESIGVSPSALAAALAAGGNEVHVVCDCLQRDLWPTGVGDQVRLHTMRGERWRIVRRPLEFRAWAPRVVESTRPDLAISITPCVAPRRHGVWAPGVEWGLTGVREELARFGMYSGIKRSLQWHLSRWRAGRAAARVLGQGSAGITLVAPDTEHAAALALLLGYPREQIAIIGHASDLAPPAEAERRSLRAKVRAALGIGNNALVALAAIERSSGPSAASIVPALMGASAACPQTPIRLLLTGTKQVAALRMNEAIRQRTARSVADFAIVTAGRTERWDALLAASDLGMITDHPSSPRDPCFIVDCLRWGIGVIAGSRTRAAAALARTHGQAIHLIAEPTGGWMNVVPGLFRSGWHTTAAAAAREASASLAIDGFARRLITAASGG